MIQVQDWFLIGLLGLCLAWASFFLGQAERAARLQDWRHRGTEVAR